MLFPFFGVHIIVHLVQEAVDSSFSVKNALAHRKRQLILCSAFIVELYQLISQAFFDVDKLEFALGFGYDYEFIACKSDCHTFLRLCIPDDLGSVDESLVACGVTVHIIYAFEKVDIDHYTAHMSSSSGDIGKDMVEIISVVELCKRVDVGKLILQAHISSCKCYGY